MISLRLDPTDDNCNDDQSLQAFILYHMFRIHKFIVSKMFNPVHVLVVTTVLNF